MKRWASSLGGEPAGSAPDERAKKEERSQPDAELIIYAPSGAVVTRWPLSDQEVTIGRDSTSDIQLDGRNISRSHAKVIRTPSGHRIVDLESTNGVRKGGVRGAFWDLSFGDEYELGNYRLAYVVSGEDPDRTIPDAPPASESRLRVDDQRREVWLSGRGPPPSSGEIDKTRVSGTSATRTFAAGRYVARQLLGEGSQKSVFLVHDTALERDCALSLIKTDLVDPDDLTRVRREAQAMAQLGAQPHIVTVFDIGDEEGRPYIVCEYVSGGDLRQELHHAAGSLPLHRAVAIAMDVCRALAVVHRRGIVHRDIKPANIWLTEDGSAKLGDFGIALAADRSRLTMAGTVTGTPAYMAPEQALGEDVDARSDLYSLGCVLYEMACGRPPFPGDDPLAVISQHVNVAPSPPSEHNQDVPQDLEGLILKLLAKAKDERPSSAQEALAELERLAAELA